MPVNPFTPSSARRWSLALATAALLALTVPARGQTPPAQPEAAAAPAPQPPPDSPVLVFGSDAGIVIYTIKDDQTAAFEEVVGRIHGALSQSENPVRKQQLAGWKVFRAVERGPSGAVVYFFIMDPVVKDADYGMARILAEAYPRDARAITDKANRAYLNSSRLNLQKVAPFAQ